MQGEALLKPELAAEAEHSMSFDFLYLLRIIFYLLVALKLIELSFLRRKKPSLKERVYRKFLLAHQELLKTFTEEDKNNMENTLTNTLKNVSVDYRNTRTKTHKSRKRVNFSTDKNDYYDPKASRIEEDEDVFLEID